MEDADSLKQSIELYKEQISKVNQSIEATPPGEEKNELIILRNNIEELLNLTQESLSSLENKSNSGKPDATDDDDPFAKEYALFKAELGELDSNNSNNDESTKNDEETVEEEAMSDEDDASCIMDELSKIVGTKCQAPYTCSYAPAGYHNALVIGLETPDSITDLVHIKVKVLFTNPTERDMVTCPYFLDDKCNFGEEKCNFSHGYTVSFGDLKEYREPDFSNLKRGSRVLAKIGDAKVWKQTAIEDIVSDEEVLVKHEGNFAAVPIHDVFPLVSEDADSESSWEESDNEAEGESVRVQEEMVERSLTTQPPAERLGQWEQFTKGIGSKLMAKMGYVVGCGLGKRGDGRLDPVQATVLPAGKSLDHCMALKEAAGGKEDLFSAERLQRKIAARELRRSQKAYQRERHREKHGVFAVINREINAYAEAEPGSSKAKSNPTRQNISKTTNRELNVERLKIGEDMRESEKRIYVLSESLERQKPDSESHRKISARLENERSRLRSLRAADGKIEREQMLRQTKKKMTVF